MDAKKRRVVFMGTPEFAVSALESVLNAGYEVVGVVTVPDRQSGRGLKVCHSAVKEYAMAHNLHLMQPEKLRDEKFLEELKSLDADVFVVVAFRMLPEVVWSMPRMGTFNLHASLLPQYRGAAPINWAIINGEKKSGVTTFLLNDKIDEGKILMQRQIAIDDDETAGTLHDKLAEAGAELTVRTLDALFDGSIEARSQEQPERMMPAPKIFKSDCAIDWHKGKNEIRNFVRGLCPYPSATTTMLNERGDEISLKIFEVSTEEGGGGNVGEIITDQKSHIKISVNDGFVSIISLQMSGKKRLSVNEFLRGYNVKNWKLKI